MFDDAVKWVLHDPARTKRLGARAAAAGLATVVVFSAGRVVGASSGPVAAPAPSVTSSSAGVFVTPRASATATGLPVGADAGAVATAYVNAWLRRSTFAVDDAGNRAWLDSVKPYATVALGAALEGNPRQLDGNVTVVPAAVGGGVLRVVRVENVSEVGDRLLLRATLTKSFVDVVVSPVGDEWRVSALGKVGKKTAVKP